MKTNSLFTFCFVAGLSVALLTESCKDSPPEPQGPTLLLTVEDASCTEAWLKATTTEVPATVRLLRDGQRVSNLRLLTSDSLLVDQGLLPRRTYTYQLQKLNADSSVVETSASVQLTTMDTTSHNFTWQIDTLGVTSSVLYDVAIINDTLAYAVGEMYLRDSTGQADPQAWNAAKWNGQRWELKRIPFIGPCSAVLYPPLKAIWVFSATNILVTNGGSIVRYDGVNATMDCGMNSLLAGAINKMYGVSPQDVYAVGNVGTIVHYDGVQWRRVESGTNVYLTDVWGTPDGVEVWTCGWDNSGGGVVLRLAGNIVQKIWDKQAPVPHLVYRGKLNSLWSDGRSEFVLTGTGDVFRHSLLDPRIVRRDQISLGHFAYALRGTARNDLLLAGDFSMIWHWNGSTWHKYQELTNTDDRLFALSLSHTQAIAVGTRFMGISHTGLVIRGRR